MTSMTDYIKPEDTDQTCSVCGGDRYVTTFYEREKCDSCHGTGDKYFIIHHKEDIYISSRYKNKEIMLSKFLEKDEIFHIPSNKKFNVYVTVLGKPEPFVSLNDFNESNYN